MGHPTCNQYNEFRAILYKLTEFVSAMGVYSSGVRGSIDWSLDMMGLMWHVFSYAIQFFLVAAYYLSVSDISIELACKSLPVWMVDVLLFPLPLPETIFLSVEETIPRIDLGVVFDLGVVLVATLSVSSSSSEKSETELAREGIWCMACVAFINSCWRLFAATGVVGLEVYSTAVSKIFYK